MKTPLVRHLNNNFDQAAILACLADLAFDPGFQITAENQSILAALRRSSEEYRYASIEQISDQIKQYDDDQIAGLVNSVKGIAHEMEFVRIENEDGDSVYASLYADTNHPGFDVQLFDEDSGDYWPVQLKATDQSSYVSAWMEDHPDGEIVVTDELAGKLGLPGSGVENGELTQRTEDFVDALLEYGEQDTLASCFPHLSVLSVALVIWELWRRYRNGDIDYRRFKLLAALASTGKVLKLGLLTALMSVPGLNVAVGAAMVAQLIYSTTEFSAEHLSRKQPAPA